MCSEYYCAMVYNVEYHTLLSLSSSNDGRLAYSYNLIFSFGIQFFNSASFFSVESELNCMQKLVFGIIITDLKHWHLRLKWRDYHSIIAQWTPYKSHNAKRIWFVLVVDVIILQAYTKGLHIKCLHFHVLSLLYDHRSWNISINQKTDLRHTYIVIVITLILSKL